MTAISATAAPLDIGRVIQDLFAVLRRNFAPFLILAAILSGVPAVLAGIIEFNMFSAGPFGGLGQGFFVGLVSLVAGLVLQGALISGTVQDMNGRRPLVGDCLAVGLRKFLPLFAIGLLFGIAVVLGMILFFVPGVMIAVAWSVAVPAFVAERLDLFDAFARSAELTRGNRWRIFGLFVVYVLASMLFQGLILGLAGTAGLAGVGSLMRDVILQPIVAVASALVGGTGAAVLYVELRRAREGVGPEAIAAVFD